MHIPAVLHSRRCTPPPLPPCQITVPSTPGFKSSKDFGRPRSQPRSFLSYSAHPSMLYPCFLLVSLISLASALLPSVSAKESRYGIWDCTLSRDYFNIQPLAPLVRFSDCKDALSQLLADAADFGKHKYEWSSWGMPFHPRQGGPREGRGTPKKYVAGMFVLLFSKRKREAPSGAGGRIGGKRGTGCRM
ncbi:MAG: hypothetical protein Q9197_004958 [Variospora fuerteventurae]